MRGKLIAFDGIDGVGKDTQLKLLIKKLGEEGIKHKSISFPRHNNPSSYFVDKYLSTEHPYGDPDKINPYQASVFYSLDRYDASFEIKKWLEEGYSVILDRYVGSNMGHQGGKIEDSDERSKYVEWLFDFEYRLLGIPKPDLNIIFWLPPEVTQTRLSLRAEERGEKMDGHEINLDHLKRAQMAYLWASKCYPDDFKVVKCFEEERELSEQEICLKVWELLKREWNINRQ